MPRALKPASRRAPTPPPDAAAPTPPFRRIYAVVARIPRGRVATYGQVARLAGRVTARLVGYAMAATPDGLGIPWQRVINARGEVSLRRRGDGHLDQRRLLEREGVRFDDAGRIDLGRHAWRPDVARSGPR